MSRRLVLSRPVLPRRCFSATNPPKEVIKINVLFPVIGGFTMAGLAYMATQANSGKPVTLQQLKEKMATEQLENVVVVNQTRAIFVFDNASQVVCDIPDYKYLESQVGVDPEIIVFKNQPPNVLLTQLLGSAFFLGGLYLMMRRQPGFTRLFEFTKDNRIEVQTSVATRFADIVDQKHASDALQEYLHILKNPEPYQQIGAKPPKGALLSGPPGTGKTLLAKALAGESGLPFVSLSGSDLNAIFVGVGAAKVKELFSMARKKVETHDGCIIFIDEIDAIGQKRGVSGMNVNTERENTLNQLLTEMDGFTTNENIMVLGATNRPETLDPALLRPGRFDRKITVNLPSKQGRSALFTHYLNKLNTGLDASALDNLAKQASELTPQASGADIANICNEAALMTVRAEEKAVTSKQINEAIDYVNLGAEKQEPLITRDREIVAVHEAGHALMSFLLVTTPNPIKVSIIPREKGALGFSQTRSEPGLLVSRQQIEDQICVLMAGRAAEELFFSQITTGASNDIMRATDLVYEYLNVFCMDEHNSFLSLRENDSSFKNRFSEQVKGWADERAMSICNSLYERTLSILRDNSYSLDRLKGALLDKDTLYEEDVKMLITN